MNRKSTINRRQFIQMSSATAMAATLANMSHALANTSDNNEDYKALVCVFLYGGMDNHDTIIPYDANSYQQWANIRSSLLPRYPTPRDRNHVLPLNTPARFGQRQFALPPEMSGLHALYQQGKMAVMGNVGPLIEPVTASSMDAQSARIPSRLFSHNDQQSTWMSGSTEGAQLGWGGLMNDALIASGKSSSNTFATMSMSSGDLLLTGNQTAPYHLIGGSAPQIELLEYIEGEFGENLAEQFRAASPSNASYLQQDMANKQREALDQNNFFNQAIAGANTQIGEFPTTPLGRQLKQVANVISARNQLQTKRQIFVVTLGGFDTHSAQATSLPQLQTAIDQGISAFYQSMHTQGLANNVTLFTASDFGRTLAVNGDGTDHGWGSHHFVVGGGVNGGTIFGDIPEARFNHAHDAGSGRLIPSTSVEQYAASFAHWMGLSQSDVQTLFPRLSNFAAPPSLMNS